MWVELWEGWELLMGYEPPLDDPIAGEPELWRCAGCNGYFLPDVYDWHIDEECKGQLGIEEGESNE
jgi:hypothetical protein